MSAWESSASPAIATEFRCQSFSPHSSRSSGSDIPAVPGCVSSAKPLGGVVKTYGGIGRNHFDGGVLIGDAGSFVDPMTGEGITPGMESALIAASTVAESLERGRFDAAFLSQFERDFRRYFDPAMLYLDLCAALLRNWHFREFWLRAGMRGFARSQGRSGLRAGRRIAPSAAWKCGLRSFWHRCGSGFSATSAREAHRCSSVSCMDDSTSRPD